LSATVQFSVKPATYFTSKVVYYNILAFQFGAAVEKWNQNHIGHNNSSNN